MDGDEFEQVVGCFFAQREQATDDNITLTLDGKVLRGSIAEGQTQGVHLLAAYLPQRGGVLLQVEVADKANEIRAAPRLLQALDGSGCVLTGDALFTQRDLCDQIVRADADYVLPVKDNQPTLQRASADVFMPASVSAGHSVVQLPETHAHSLSTGHGRIEYRLLTLSSQLNDYLDWPHLAQVFRLQRVVQRHKTGQLTYQVVFGITSLTEQACSPQRLLHIIRQHWHIENRLHYVRDVTLHEDACRIRQRKRQRLLASLNNLLIGLIRRTDFKYVPEARRYFSINYALALQLLL